MQTWIRFLLAAGAFSLVGCEYFSNVVIPATDVESPTAFVGVYDADKGEYIRIGVWDPIEERVTNPNKTYALVAAGMDAGGMRRITMTSFGTIKCTIPGGVNVTQWKGAPKIEEQEGTVGSTVSNGLYTYFTVKIGDQCGPGSRLVLYEIFWSAFAEDFYGHKSAAGGGRFFMQP